MGVKLILIIKMKEKNIFFIALVALLTFLVAYFLVFNGRISENSQEWSNFASYLSGMMAIVLTSINIYVFVKLTKAIDSNDDIKRNQELNVQKTILLTNLRQAEINKFDSILTNALILKPTLLSADVTRTLVEATSYIETFVNTKKHIFPILEKKNFEEKISRLHKVLLILDAKLIESFSKLKDSETKEFVSLSNKNEIMEFLNLKNDVLTLLQEFTINTIEYDNGEK